jgi:predicted  nucleic acid-binding Zn-ribbon protein
MLDALERTRAHAVELEHHAEALEQQVQRLNIQIDEAKKERDVAEITETSYFHYLQGRAREMRTRRSATPAPPAG